LNAAKPEQIFEGNGVSPGISLGQALKLDSYNRVILKILLEDSLVEEEVKRVQRAIQASREQLERLKLRFEEKVGRERSFILDAHILMLEDRRWGSEIEALIRNTRANAEWAVRQTTEGMRRAYESLEDEYFRDRVIDIENVVERILANLAGDKPFSWAALPQDLVIVSHNFNPSTFAIMDLEKVRGLALESGGRTSHTAILARSLGLPAVMQIRDFLTSVTTGDTVLLDGDEGRLILNPTPERLDRARARLQKCRALHEPAPFQAGAAVTKDGVAVSLRANTELPHEVRLAQRCGAQGIGLFRSEFLFFADPHGFPTMPAQLETYQMLAREMKPHPVAVRTLDAGVDRVMASPSSATEPNPSMGLRGIRLSLAARELFRTQVEAILRASLEGKMEIVLPMISTVEEVWEARKLIEEVRREITRDSGRDMPCVPVGAMIEVPAAVLSLESVAREVDLLCIGTNDLVQYTLAVDRGNPQVAHLFQPLHPSILHCLQRIAEVGEALKKPVRICGEISANPFFAVLLLGMGFTELSMNPLSIPTIRKVVQEVTLAGSQQIFKKALGLPTASAIGDLVLDAVSKLVQTDLSPYVKEIRAQGGGPSDYRN